MIDKTNVGNGLEGDQLLKNRRIFYIEDDVKNRLVVQMILENVGARLEFERWGFIEIAIPKLKAFKPELILLDLMFPLKHTGYDVFDAIRKHAEFATIPIVAVSASDPGIEVPKAKARWFVGYIAKPLNLQKFPLQIAHILAGNTLWGDEV